MNKTWIAACCAVGCHASVSVHYGRKTVLPLCTLQIMHASPKKKKEMAKTLCMNTWNRRNDNVKEFVTRAYRAMKTIAKDYAPIPDNIDLIDLEGM